MSESDSDNGESDHEVVINRNPEVENVVDLENVEERRQDEGDGVNFRRNEDDVRGYLERNGNANRPRRVVSPDVWYRNRNEEDRKILLYPDRFDGTSSWQDYRAHFDSCARINKWGEMTKARFLAASLKGSAQQILTDFGAVDFTYRELVSLLERRFGPGEKAELYLAELRNRQRKPGESLQELGQAMRRLTALAYPEVNRAALDRLARMHFTDAIQDREIKMNIFHAHPLSLEDTIRVALEAESFLEAEKIKNRVRPKYGNARSLNNETETCRTEEYKAMKAEIEELKARLREKSSEKFKYQDKSKMTCFECGKKGHFRKDCYVFKKKQGQNKISGNGEKPTRGAWSW